MLTLDLFKYYAPEYKGEDNFLFHSRGLFFQNPINFNDPWDCTPPQITIPRTINTIEQVWNHISRNDPTAESRWQEIRRRPRAEIKASFEKIFEQSFLNLRSKIGICSLSFIPDSELLWAHYSISHSGYLLHFQINMKDYYSNPTLKNIATPIPVIYLRERKCWNFADYYNERLKFVYDYVRFKSYAWSYECEFRLLNATSGGFVKVPQAWLKSIVLGLNADSHLRARIKNIGKELDIPVFTAVMNKKEYKIDIPGLKIDGIRGKGQYHDVVESGKFEL